MARKASPGAIPPDTKCNARNRPGAKNPLCRRGAGEGTDHVGQGRCKAHGGDSPIKHGRYSVITRPRLKELIEHFEADPDPLNILAEVHMMRALCLDYIERYDEFTEALIEWHESFQAHERSPKPYQVVDISSASDLVERSSRIVERIERIRNANSITLAEFGRCQFEMGRVVESLVKDPAILQKIQDGWLNIRVSQ